MGGAVVRKRGGEGRGEGARKGGEKEGVGEGGERERERERERWHHPSDACSTCTCVYTTSMGDIVDVQYCTYPVNDGCQGQQQEGGVFLDDGTVHKLDNQRES